MKPFVHAKSSAARFGGKPEDYQAVHDFMDSPKSAHPSMRHRAILHNSFGIFLAERIFGTTVTNAAGQRVAVRDVAERHVMEDLGFIPSLDEFLKHMKLAPWMAGMKKRKFILVD